MTSFTLFPNLPEELRLKIWQEAANNSPRVLDICTLPSGPVEKSEDDPPPQTEALFPYYTEAKIPSILHVSQESRLEALKSYTLSFPRDHQPPQIYYNPDIDTLYFPSWCWTDGVITDFETPLSDATKSLIQKIALDNTMWFSFWEDGSLNNQMRICEFPNLKELVLVTRELEGCGCCKKWEGPEKGEVKWVGLEEREVKCRAFYDHVVRDCGVEFGKIEDGFRESGRGGWWRRPEVVMCRIERNGVLH